MEVKINKEIRNYTESMFFGLSMRQFIFSPQLDVYSGGFPLCHDGLCEIQRNDRRAVCVGVDKIGVSDAEEDFIFARQPLLRSVEAEYRSKGEGLARPDKEAETAGGKARETENEES